jgi:hypothetical protein
MVTNNTLYRMRNQIQINQKYTEVKMYQQRLSHMISTNPFNVTVILIVVIGLVIGGMAGLQAVRTPISDTSPAIQLASLSQAQVAEAARYQALAGQAYNLYGSTAWTRAPKALTRAQIADAARLSAMAGEKYNLYGSTAWTRAPRLLTRAQSAEAARLSAMAEERYNLYGSTAWTKAPKPDLSRAQLAEAARLTALAIHFGKPPASISPEVADQITP